MCGPDYIYLDTGSPVRTRQQLTSEVEVALHVDQEVRPVAAKLAEAQRHGRRDRLLLIDYIVKRLRASDLGM
ncbi:MAG: hypothetical protein J2P54_00925 [Bradyrhizobiaceae bacterium]|nr:hypothetical protein [Bradyrhizobiaceae bacterium]